jgi:hypothetical protein
LFSVSKLPAHLTTCLSLRWPTALTCSICPLPNPPSTTLPHYASSRTSTPILLPSSLPSRLQALPVAQDARARSMHLQPQQSRTGRQTDDLKNAQECVLTQSWPQHSSLTVYRRGRSHACNRLLLVSHNGGSAHGSISVFRYTSEIVYTLSSLDVAFVHTIYL